LQNITTELTKNTVHLWTFKVVVRVLLSKRDVRTKLGGAARQISDGVRLCGLVVRVSGYRYRGPGFDPRRYHIF